MSQTEDLTETFALEAIETNLFRGFNLDTRQTRIFGGQVVAQALIAAQETVEDRICHSLHGYFIRPGDPSIPILYEVDRARDGRGFTTRRVTAIQHGRQIFNLAASFQVAETGFDHQSPMPATPPPEALLANLDPTRMVTPTVRAMEIRLAEPVARGQIAPPTNRVWMRAPAPIGDRPGLQQANLAYASDMGLLGVAARPHGVDFRTPSLQAASLDHAVWFHRPTDFHQWHLYVQDSPSASGGRGFTRGQFFDAAGRLVASVAQEGLIRKL